MSINNYVLIGYAAFLLIMLIINLLYFFQIFRYRLPGDASLAVAMIHIILVLAVLGVSSTLL